MLTVKFHLCNGDVSITLALSQKNRLSWTLN